MDVIITLRPDGSTTLAVDDTQGLSFEEAQVRLAALAQTLNLTGAPLTLVGDIERHAHDERPVGQHTHTDGTMHWH